MNAYNLSICVSPSIMQPLESRHISACEQTAGTSEVVCFLIENYILIFGEESEYILGEESDIVFDNGPGEDSDSSLDQDASLQSIDCEDEQNDSDKEGRFTGHSDLSELESNLHTTFAHSDSSLESNESEERIPKINVPSVSMVPENIMIESKSSPNSPVHLRKDLPRSQSHDVGKALNEVFEYQRVEAYFQTDHGETYQRRLLRQPRPKRFLSSSTTSAELIEHKRYVSESEQQSSKEETKFESRPIDMERKPKSATQQRTGSPFSRSIVLKKRERSGNSLSEDLYDFSSVGSHDGASSPTRSESPYDSSMETSPVITKRQVSPPILQSVEVSAAPKVAFKSVDRRRQPAAPSYDEHLQRMQSMYRVITGRRPSSVTGPSSVVQEKVENYKPPKVTGHKKLRSADVQPFPNRNLSKQGNKREGYKSQTSCLRDDFQTANKSSKLENDVNDLKIETINIAPLMAPIKMLDRNSTEATPIPIKLAPLDLQKSCASEKSTVSAMSALSPGCSLTPTSPVFEEAFNERPESSSSITKATDCTVIVPSKSKDALNTATQMVDYPSITPTTSNQSISSSVSYVSDNSLSKSDNSFSSLEEPSSPMPADTSEASKQGPFTLQLSPDRKTLSSSCEETIATTISTSLDIQRKVLTKPPKKIDQLAKIESNNENRRPMTGRELRRSNRKLKSEIRNAFREGMFSSHNLPSADFIHDDEALENVGSSKRGPGEFFVGKQIWKEKDIKNIRRYRAFSNDEVNNSCEPIVLHERSENTAINKKQQLKGMKSAPLLQHRDHHAKNDLCEKESGQNREKSTDYTTIISQDESYV